MTHQTESANSHNQYWVSNVKPLKRLKQNSCKEFGVDSIALIAGTRKRVFLAIVSRPLEDWYGERVDPLPLSIHLLTLR